jgi:hypothetical protein
VKAGGDTMKRNFNYIALFILLLTCTALKSNAQAIKVEATVDKVSIPLGDQTRLHLIAHIQAKDEITFPQLADSIGKIQIVSVAKPDTSFDKDNVQSETITRNYTVTSFTPGTYSIPPFTFKTKTGTYTTDSLILQFKPVAVDTTKAIYDIKQPLQVIYTWLDWLKDNWPWVAIPLVAILLIIGLTYYIVKRPKKEVVIVPLAPAVPPHIVAMTKLNELRDKKLWQQDEVKLYHSELSDTLREYLENRYRIHALEQTSDEIFASIKNAGIPADGLNKLRQILVMADLVKFAKEKPLPQDNEQSMDNAISFIMQTKQEPQAPAAKEDMPK